MEFRGEDCPLLFGKHKPLRFVDHNIGKDGERHKSAKGEALLYDFGYARVEIEFGIMPDGISPERIIMVTGSEQNGFNSDALFDPRIFELYQDALEQVDSSLKRAAITLPFFTTINLGDYSFFRRTVSYVLDVDVQSLGFENPWNTEGILTAAKDSYLALEKSLIDVFGISKEELIPLTLMGFNISGNEKILSLKNGVRVITTNPTEINPWYMPQRLLTFQEIPRKNLEEVFNHIKTATQDDKRLQETPHGRIGFGVIGNYASGIINLSRIKIPSGLEGRTLLGIEDLSYRK